MRFEHCYIQNPVCMPSRASLFTGRYCQNHGVRKNGALLDPVQPNVARALLAAGHHTASIGKLHFLPHWGRDYDRPHPSMEYGFRTMLNSDEPGCYRDEYIRWVEREHPEYLEALRAPLPVPPGYPIPPANVDVPGGRGLVEHVDVCPTLLEATGAPVYSGMKGTSLLALSGGTTAAGRPDVLIEFRDVRTGFSVKTLRSAAYKYSRSRRGDETEEVLADLRRDPDEFRNVAADASYAPVLGEMRSRLLDRLQDAEDDLPEPTSAW